MVVLGYGRYGRVCMGRVWYGRVGTLLFAC